MKTSIHVWLSTALGVLVLLASPLAAQYPAPGFGLAPGYGPPPGYGPAPYPGMGQMMAPGMAPMGVAPANFVGPNYSLQQAAPVSHLAGAECEECGHDSCAGECSGCYDCGWCYRVGVFADFLYLRPRDAEVAYAVPVNGPVVSPLTQPPIEVGRVGMTDGEFRAAFRGGFTYVLSPGRSITAQYTMFESNITDSISTAAPNVLYSLVAHPSTFTAGNQMLDAEASHSIDFDLVDVDYRGMIDCGDLYQTNFLLGVRYAKLDQQFRSTFSAAGTENVDTNIYFDGLGVRAGLEGERFTASRRWLAYGRLIGSLMAGEFSADYRQSRSFDPTVVQTSWEAGRLVPILDLELGFGWQSRCGTWRITCGYMFNSWFNVVKTDDWIDRVKQSDFVDLGDTLTFDGLIARVEGRF